MPLASKAASVADMLEAWYEHGVEVKDWTPATAHGYRSTLNAHLIPALGRHRLDKLTPSHVQALLNELRAGGLSPQTVKNVRAVLSSALSLAMKWERVGRNVAALTDAPRAERADASPLTPDDAMSFLTAVEPHRLGPLFTVTTALGLRQSEAVGLTWDTVDMEAQVIDVRRRTYRIDGRWHTGRTKSGRARIIPFPDEVA